MLTLTYSVFTMRIFHPALRSIMLALAMMAILPAGAMDIAVIDHAETKDDHRRDFSRIVLRAALERTQDEYGPYRIDEHPVFMERTRLFNALKEGKKINIVGMLANAEWLQGLPSVPVPIDLGLQSWRVLLADSQNLPRLHQLAASGQLAEARAGVGSTWALRRILEENNYRVVTGNSYDGMFLMLRAGRFDYLPRSLDDVFREFDHHRQIYPGLAIEPSIVLHARMPWLFFVAPQEQRLRRRVAAGLETMLKDGSLEQLVLAYFRTDLQRIRICDRIHIDLPNSQLDKALRERRELWLDPFEPRHRICPRRTRAAVTRARD